MAMYWHVYSDDLLLWLVYTFKYTRFWPGVQHIWYYTRIHMSCTCCRGQKRMILRIDLYIYILYTRLHFECKSIRRFCKMENGPESFARRIRQNKEKDSDALASMTGSCNESDSFESLQFWVNRSPEEWSWTISVKFTIWEIHLIKILGASFSDELLATIPGNICKRGFYKKDFSSCEVVVFPGTDRPTKAPWCNGPTHIGVTESAFEAFGTVEKLAQGR